jgi:hypothetical protein
MSELVKMVEENDQKLWKSIMLGKTTTCTPSGLFGRAGAALKLDSYKYGVAFHQVKKRGESYFSLIDGEAEQTMPDEASQRTAQASQDDPIQQEVAQLTPAQDSAIQQEVPQRTARDVPIQQEIAHSTAQYAPWHREVARIMSRDAYRQPRLMSQQAVPWCVM